MNTERAVLVGVHTPTSLLRLEDITLLLEDDPRIQLIYTQVPDQLGNGVAQQLQQLEVRTIPWQEARRQTFDLTISASLHQMGDVAAAHRFTAPHGAGYNKLWPDWATEPGGERQVYGLDRRSLLDDDNQPIFDAIVLPHDDHLATLTRQCPEAVTAAVVAETPATTGCARPCGPGTTTGHGSVSGTPRSSSPCPRPGARGRCWAASVICCYA
ncbi:hypothetical protein GCM10029964_095280 [Kibdelosporangium lantanae]